MKLPIENRKYSTEITADNDGEHVSIAGWVHEKRDLGGVFFLIVRDREGFAQVTLHKGEVERELFERVNVREKEGRRGMLARMLFEVQNYK